VGDGPRAPADASNTAVVPPSGTATGTRTESVDGTPTGTRTESVHGTATGTLTEPVDRTPAPPADADPHAGDAPSAGPRAEPSEPAR
jgi:hypothetical protein